MEEIQLRGQVLQVGVEHGCPIPATCCRRSVQGRSCLRRPLGARPSQGGEISHRLASSKRPLDTDLGRSGTSHRRTPLGGLVRLSAALRVPRDEHATGTAHRPPRPSREDSVEGLGATAHVRSGCGDARARLSENGGRVSVVPCTSSAKITEGSMQLQHAGNHEGFRRGRG